MANETYWQFMLEIVNLWMQYQAAKKLYINATHEETKFKVMGVVNQYYGGSIAKVFDAERGLSNSLDRKLERFGRYCDKLGIKPMTRDWLYHNIPNSKAAGRYRRIINKNLKNGIDPAPLEANK